MDEHTLILLNRARDDDAAAVGLLFERYRDPLRRALRKMLGEDYRVRIADSEDAAHDAILSALGDLRSFEYRGDGSFLAWLLKRAEFALLNRIKASQRQRRDPGPGRIQPIEEGLAPDKVDLSVAGLAHRNETREVIQEALAKLPPKERDVILLRKFMELDTQTICQELDLPSPSAARNLYVRAQARLAIVISQLGHSPETL